MKKSILLTIAAVMVASLTQAATVQWKVSGSSASVGQTVYLVLTSEIPAKITDISQITGTAFASGEIIKYSSRSFYASGMEAETPVSAGQTAGYTIFFVSGDSYLIGGTGTVTGYGETDTPVDPIQTTVTFTAPGGAGWVSVPEPTTVALLALGLAALGMKRKVA